MVIEFFYKRNLAVHMFSGLFLADLIKAFGSYGAGYRVGMVIRS